MKRQFYLSALLLLPLLGSIILSGCYVITRTEEDLYTITQKDTTIREEVNNVPGERENGTIYPSPRTVEIIREYVQRDSTVERHYPAFLRFGGVETASFFSNGSTQGSGNGLFGLYDLPTLNRTTDTKTFTADMYRFMPYEVRLRWFDDAPDWTIGTAALEIFHRPTDSSVESNSDETLIGILPLYIRKRFFLREEPPYVMVVPFVGLSILPMSYLNAGATIDVGSMGGLNFRGYAGFIGGTSALIGDEARAAVSFPYVGVGVSVLDFVNRTEELFIEWKDHDHNALEVSALNVDVVRSLSSDTAAFGVSDPQPGAATPPFTGFMLRFGSASIPVPIGERRWYIGTSMLNVMALNSTDIAFGFLPLRTGYRLDLIGDELVLEPFGEFTYYPSTAWHLGVRSILQLPPLDQLGFDFPITINLLAGLVTGSTNVNVVANFDDFEAPDDFTTPYVGIGIGIGNKIFSPEEVMRK